MQNKILHRLSKSYKIILFGLGIVVLSGCQKMEPWLSTPETAAVPTSSLVLTTQSPIPDAADYPPPQLPTIASSTPGPEPAQPAQRTQIKLTVLYSPESQTAEVEEKIIFLNQTGVPIKDLLLVVEPNRRKGVFQLIELYDDVGAKNEYFLEDIGLRIPLENQINPGGQIVFTLKYKLNLPPQGSALGYSQRQANFGDWYPYPPPYVPGQGWLVHPPAPVGEHLVYDQYDFQVEIQINSVLKDWVIAASAPARQSEQTYLYHHTAARNFAWSASRELITLEDQFKNTKLLMYVFPEHQAAGEAALQVMKQAVVIYSDKFSAYPHPALSAVEADFFDGMEYDGMYFLGIDYYANYFGGRRNYLTALTAHETAHQWWYGLVGNDQALDPWLDEALCTYSELIYYREIDPLLEDWWWSFRVSSFEPAGLVGSTVYDHTSFRGYVNAVYLRGALFLEGIRKLIGPEQFDSLIAGYAKQYSGKIASPQNFLDLFFLQSGQAGQDLLDQFLTGKEK